MESHNLRKHWLHHVRILNIWSVDSLLESKNVANSVLMTMYVLCLTEYITLW
jgi:hypothetical protein